VIITTTLIRDYLLNYARSLIYTTSLSYANIIAADCSFDMLSDGTAQHVSSPLILINTNQLYIVQVVQPSSVPLNLFYGNSPAPTGISKYPSHSRVAPIPPPIFFAFQPSTSNRPRSDTPPTPTLRLPPCLGHERAAHNVAYRPQGQRPRPGMSTFREYQRRY